MLNIDTKRRINNARNILVGKIPDPKAQVEQITIALIYKFMDDMDQENVELGGKPQYFVDDLADFSWAKLMSNQIGGQERTELYIRAINQFSMSEKVPELFRRIFKGAYLPYRDHETLNLFLKEINWFNYHNSEKLGDAYEYLLSILGSQGDAGQFRTPRHIIDFIVEVVDPTTNDRILDPACGTAGFLIAAFKHIIRINSSNYNSKTYVPTFARSTVEENASEDTQFENKYRGDKLIKHPKKYEQLLEHIIGYDISPDMVRLATVNLYLHGFKNPHIFEYDSLTYTERWDETFDVILANPPFMTPKGGIRPHNKFQIHAKRSEVLFVDYIAEHLKINGKAGIIVPEGIIFQSSNAYKDLRKMLGNDWGLYAVVSLPAGVFQPYSGVKTSILFLDKKLSKKVNEILFINVDNDGYDLGAQRKGIRKNDLPEAFRIIKAWQKGKKIESKNAIFVTQEKIAEDGDYNLTGNRYKEIIDYSNVKWDMVKLGDVAKFIDYRGKTPNKTSSGIPLITAKNVKNGFISETPREFISSEEYFKWMTRGIPHIGDVLVTTEAPLGNVAQIIHKEKIALAQRIITLSPNRTILNDSYLKYILLSSEGQKRLIAKKSGSTVYGIRAKLLKLVQIPLPPLEVQKEIVEELDSYQKVIDGARQVVENWKPRIKIDPEWEMVKFNKICTLEYGASLPKKNRIEGVFPVMGSNGISGFHNQILINGPAIIIGRKGSAGEVVWENRDCFPIDTTYYVKLTDKTIYDFKFLFFILKSLDLTQLKSGAGIPGLNRNDVYRKHKLPLPPMSVQKEIVAQIESEQKMVDECKKLIEIHEQKIKNKIAEVWGEE